MMQTLLWQYLMPKLKFQIMKILCDFKFMPSHTHTDSETDGKTDDLALVTCGASIKFVHDLKISYCNTEDSIFIFISIIFV